MTASVYFRTVKKKSFERKGGHGWRENEQDESIFYLVGGVAAPAAAAVAAVVIVGRRLRKLLFKWRWGCITLSDVDECVSRSVGRASLSHSSSSFCLSLSIFFQKSSIVLSVYSFTAFCLMMKCCFWNMFLTPFFIYKHQKGLRQV